MSALMPISCCEQPIKAVASGKVTLSPEGVAGAVAGTDGPASAAGLHDEPKANPAAGGNGGGAVDMTGGGAEGEVGAGIESAADWLKA